MDVGRFKDLPLMGILRGVEAGMIEPLAEAVVSSGLQTLEITMNTRGAPELIRRLVKAAAGSLAVGAGTVLSMEDLHAALDAGATFAVMPTLVRDVTQYCAERGIPAFPGALTPQEIYDAWQAGATMVKVFPAGLFGPPYFKEVKGPFQDVELLACGGVTPDSLGEFFRSGASAASFGGSVFKPEWLRDGQFDRIAAAVRELVKRYEQQLDEME